MRRRLEPGKLVEKMTSSAMGCFWILNVLEELLERVRKRFWSAGDRLRMIRLLGRNPADCIVDRRVAEIFAASHALRPVRKPFDDLLSDMTEQVLEAHVKEITAMWPDLSHKGEPEKARQSLIDLVEGEIERVRAIAEEHEESAGDDAARSRALNGFVFSPKAEAMRRWFARARGRWNAESRRFGRRHARGRRIAMRRMWHRGPGIMLALTMGGRETQG